VLRPQTVERLAGGDFDHMTKVLRRHGVLAVLGVRIVPAAPFAVEGIIAGALRIQLWKYTLGTFLGMAPGVLATTVFGYQITTALEDPSKINWWIVAAVVLAFVGLTWFVHRWFSRQTP